MKKKLALCCFVLLAFALIVFFAVPRPAAVDSPAPGGTDMPRRVKLFYHNGLCESRILPAEETPLSFDSGEPGYTCYAWVDAAGTRYESIGAFSAPDTLYQKCTVTLPEPTLHNAYFFPEDDGSYAVDEVFTRRRAARMMEALLTPRPTVALSFPDLEAADPAYPGAALMRVYGMVQDGPFSPDAPVTRGELLFWMSFCFPPAEGGAPSPWSDSVPEALEPALCLALQKGWIDPETETPEDPLTGRELLFLMNRVLERETAVEDLPPEVYASLADTLDDPVLFAALAEAGVSHSCSSLQPESWADYTILRRLDKGPHFRGNTLYWVGEDGLFVVGREENGLLFDEMGQYTSGDAELDELVLQVLDETLSGEMTPYEKLRAVYDYSITELRYGGSAVYERETDDWWQEAGLKMLRTKRGNCYSFAAAFCALSRPLGYNTKVSSGSTFGQGIHGWAYIMMDGEEHIFDPQSELVYHLAPMFDLSPEDWAWIKYEPVYSGDGALPVPTEQSAPVDPAGEAPESGQE